MTLIAEDLLLLLLDDERGVPIETTFLDVVLGGALLIELAQAGAVAVTTSGPLGGKRVRVTGTAPTDHALTSALQVVAQKERAPADLVPRLGRGQRDGLAQRLADRGILQRQDDKILGLFPRTRWPAQDVEHEDAVRRRLAAVLTGAEPADERSAGLISLLLAIDKVVRVLGDLGLGRREVTRRAKAIADGEFASKAVKDVVDSSNAAVMAAVMASAGAGAAAASS